MKAISLEMFGFMTYKNKVFIDFTKLYDSKIFLISGDTGSGKSSIFDAITFSLYGEVQRKDFDKKDFRSDFLTESDPPTYVEFVFEINQEKYRVKRIPNQKAKKSRPAVKISHDLFIYKIEDSGEKLLSDKVTEGGKIIKEIIGLDYDELSRVMILAQGEFSKFLKSSSSEKTELLSKIFSSYIYKEIEERLKEKSKDSKKKLDDLYQMLEIEIRKNELLDDEIKDEDIKLNDFKKIYENIKRIDKNLEEKLVEGRSEKDSLTKDLNAYRSKLSLYENENESIRLFKKLKKEKESLNKNKVYYENERKNLNLSKKAELISPYYKSLNELKDSKKNLIEKNEENKKKLKENEEKLKDIYKKLSTKPETEKLIEDKKNEIIKNKEIIKKFKDLKDLKESIDKNKSLYEKSKEYKKDIENLKKELEKIQAKIKERSDKAYSLSSNLKDINEKGHEKKSLYLDFKNNFEKAVRNDKDIKDLKAISLDIKKLKKDLNKKEKTLEEIKVNKKYIEINKLRKELNQTGICPVCGQSHDKDFESFDIKDYDYEQINKDYLNIKSDLQYKEKRREDLEKGIDKDLKEKSFYEEKLSKLDKKLDELRNLYKKTSSTYRSLDKEIKNLEKDYKTYQEKIEKLSESLSKIDNLDDIEKLKNKLEIKSEELAGFNEEKIKEDISKTEDFVEKNQRQIKKLEDMYKDLDKEKSALISSEKSIKDYIASTEKRIDETEKYFYNKLKDFFKDLEEFKKYESLISTYKKKEKEIEEYFLSFENLKIRLESLEKYEDREEIKLDDLKEKIKEVDGKLSNIDSLIINANIKKDKLNETNKELLKIDNKLKSLKGEDEILYKLAKIADGSLTRVKGRERINFETYILSYYFNKILSFANIRLKDMTDGQYTMIRKKDSSDGRRNFGLDIEILDSNTGKIRSEASLSGGESFIASLSLALGLSDEISQENGGIKIDSLFIDEGFGTLSDDYLEKAIKCIEKLSYNDKFIGIISHVKELKSAIDAKIEVKYSKTQGSSIEVIVWLM